MANFGYKVLPTDIVPSQILECTFCGWGQSPCLFHDMGVSCIVSSHSASAWQSSHVHYSCVRRVMRDGVSEGEGERERELRAQLPISNHYGEGKEKE